MQQLFRELKRRNVYKVAAAYVTVAFVGFQAAKLLIPSTVLPPWTDEFFLFLLIIGFPVAIVVAWAFEMTPEGVRRTADAGGESGAEAPLGARRSRSRRALGALVALGLVGAAVAGGWYLVGGGGEPEPGPRAGDRSIAVLPFEALGQAEPDVFTEGMHDDLLARLSNVAGLKVISRTSVQQYRGTDKTTAEIARELGVRWVLEGGVQEMGDQIQVNAQLIDPRTDTHAWADSYRRDLTAASLFDLQSEITKQIAASLEAELTTEEAERVERRPTDDLDAYRLYVQGHQLLARRSARSIREARDYFERALSQDSTYALAWAGLADARVLYAAYTTPPVAPDSVARSSGSFEEAMRAVLPEAKAAARRALELAPDLAEAHTALGAVYFYEQVVEPGQRKGPAALREFRRAVELKPSYAHAQQWLGDLYSELGYLDEARKHSLLAVDLSPRHAAARQVLAMVLLAQGDLEGARTHLIDRHPHRPPLILRAVLLYHEGRWDELERLATSQLPEDGQAMQGMLPWRFFLARIAVLRGDTAAARTHLAAVGRQDAPLTEGLVHAALGEEDAAFEAWREVDHWGRGTGDMRYFYGDILDPLREDPRYREVIREANRAWGLNPDGSLPGEAGS